MTLYWVMNCRLRVSTEHSRASSHRVRFVSLARAGMIDPFFTVVDLQRFPELRVAGGNTARESARSRALALNRGPPDEGWLYLAVILDLYSRRVIGWALSTRMTQDLAIAALDRALFERNPEAGLLHHSDRGSQFTTNGCRLRLEDRNLIASMSRKGDCWDNAVAESSFATLKIELGDTFSSRESARITLIDYIEVFYSHQRRHTSIGGLTPDHAEAQFELEVAA